MNSFKTIKIRELDLNLTNKCNLNCVHCAFSSDKYSVDEIEYDTLIKVIEEAIEMGLEDIHLTGGEPTLYKRLPELIEYVTGRGITARLITNGIAVDETKLALYKKLGLKSIMYSVDGMESTHESIRGLKGSFGKTMASIKTAKKLGYNIRMNAVISKTNQNEIIDLIKLSQELEINVFSFFLYSPTGREAKEQLDKVLEAHEWRNLIHKIKEYIRKENIKKPDIVSEKGFLWSDETMDFDSYKGRGGGCFYLTDICDYLILLANGDIYPCALLSDKNIRYGNIYERKLKDIIANPENKEKYNKFQKQHDLCEGCNDWNSCHGSCKAFVYSYNQQWDVTDPRCNKIMKEEKHYIPLCPLHKENLTTGKEGGYSEKVVDEL